MNAIVRSARGMGWKTGVATALCCVMGGAAGWFATMIQPAVTMGELRELDGVAFEGGTLDLVVKSQRNRPCPVDIDRWLERPDPLDAAAPAAIQRRQYVYLSVPRVPPVPAGRSSYRITIPLPAAIPVGRWYYHAQARNSCSFLPEWLARAERDTGLIPVDVHAPDTANTPKVIVPPAPALNLVTGTTR